MASSAMRPARQPGGRAVPMLLLLAAVFSRAALSQLRDAGAPAQEAKVSLSRTVNPHWAPTGCRHCHRMTDGQAAPIPPGEVEAICLGCHDGKKAKREPHPIGRTFDGEQVSQPAGWPTIDGKITCATCHAIRDACRAPGRRPLDNPAFLRGYESGRALRSCARCHLDGSEHERHNPHVMLDADGTTVREACLFCHHSIPDDAGRLTRVGEAALRSDVISLCLGCHPRHIDYFEPGHIGARVTAEIKAHMVAAERMTSGQSLEHPGVQGKALAPREPTRLPLAGGDTVVCSTCHNPHQAGVFPADSVLAYGAPAAGQERTTLRLRRPAKEICLACHDK